MKLLTWYLPWLFCLVIQILPLLRYVMSIPCLLLFDYIVPCILCLVWQVSWEALSRVVNSVPKEVLPSYIKLVRDAVSTARDKERRKKKVSDCYFLISDVNGLWKTKKSEHLFVLFNALAGRPCCYSWILSSKSSSTPASNISSGIPDFHFSPKCLRYPMLMPQSVWVSSNILC